MQILLSTATFFYPRWYKMWDNTAGFMFQGGFSLFTFILVSLFPAGQGSAGAGLAHNNECQPVRRGHVSVCSGKQTRHHFFQRRTECHR